MADTGRFQELSPTKIQEILDNAVSDKNEESHKVGMNMFNARIWDSHMKWTGMLVGNFEFNP